LGELFCGCGGLGLGALRAGLVGANGIIYKIVHGWSSDIDVDACETYRGNVGGNVICCDVRDLDIGSLGEIDCFAYGFPCNDFSNVGKKRGLAGKYGMLYEYGLEVLECYSPLFFVAENVGGIRSANGFDRIISDLSSVGGGYSIFVNMFKAEEYGVPQSRHRLIIVGFRGDTGHKFVVPPVCGRIITAGEALSGIGDGVLNNEVVWPSRKVMERLSYIKPGDNIWSVNDDIPLHLRLNVKGAKMSQIYRRLDSGRPAYTLTASGGGGTGGYHWSECRELTNRERARLQTFPDDFVFYGSRGSVRRQIGMAVPVELSRVIFNSILHEVSM